MNGGAGLPRKELRAGPGAGEDLGPGSLSRGHPPSWAWCRRAGLGWARRVAAAAAAAGAAGSALPANGTDWGVSARQTPPREAAPPPAPAAFIRGCSCRAPAPRPARPGPAPGDRQTDGRRPEPASPRGAEPAPRRPRGSCPSGGRPASSPKADPWPEPCPRPQSSPGPFCPPCTAPPPPPSALHRPPHRSGDCQDTPAVPAAPRAPLAREGGPEFGKPVLQQRPAQVSGPRAA